MVRLPQFTASAGLYKSSNSYSRAVAGRDPRRPRRRRAEVASIVQDTDGNLYSCRPLYSEGTITYLDCRRLGGDGVFAPPDAPPGHCWTETSCVLTVQFCQDRCISAGEEKVVRDWYPCGVCFGSDTRRNAGIGTLDGRAVAG
jgi:hypothetical protein